MPCSKLGKLSGIRPEAVCQCVGPLAALGVNAETAASTALTFSPTPPPALFPTVLSVPSRRDHTESESPRPQLTDHADAAPVAIPSQLRPQRPQRTTIWQNILLES